MITFRVKEVQGSYYCLNGALDKVCVFDLRMFLTYKRVAVFNARNTGGRILDTNVGCPKQRTPL